MNIYVWGSSDQVAEILNAVSNLIASGDFHSFLLLVFVLSFSLVLIKMLVRFDGQSLFGAMGFYLVTVVLIFVFMRVTVSVNIIDNVKGTARTVDSVPVGLAFMSSLFTTAERVILDIFENFYNIPDQISYSQAGYNYAPLVFNTLSKSKIPDPYLMRSVKRFIYDCFFDDVVYKNKDFQTLMYTTDIYGYMQPVRDGYTIYYSSTGPEGVTMRCSLAYNLIGNQLGNYSNTTLDSVFYAFVPVNSNNTKVSEVFNKYLGFKRCCTGIRYKWRCYSVCYEGGSFICI